MEIKNQNNADDAVTVIESQDRKGHVWLGIGPRDSTRSRHAHLRPAEARAIAYALLSFSEQVSPIGTIDAGTF